MNRQTYESRLQGLTSGNLARKRVLVVGCGAGSEPVVRLARHGVGHFQLVDPDHVEFHNLCRTAYTVADVGLPKVQALRQHLLDANPFVQVEAVHGRVQEADVALQHLDLVIATTDSFAAQLHVNALALEAGIPALFVDVHAQAAGGIALAKLPGDGACYQCIADAQPVAAGEAERFDGASGSFADIAIVDAVACKLALSILERDEDCALGRFWRGLGQRRLAVVRASPDYEFGTALWRAVLADLPTAPRLYAHELEACALYAADTLWIEPARRDDCPACHGGGHA